MNPEPRRRFFSSANPISICRVGAAHCCAAPPQNRTCGVNRIRLKQALKGHGQPEWLVSVVHCRRASGGSERG